MLHHTLTADCTSCNTHKEHPTLTLTVGSFETTPVPEHGASSSTRSMLLSPRICAPKSTERFRSAGTTHHRRRSHCLVVALLALVEQVYGNMATDTHNTNTPHLDQVSAIIVAHSGVGHTHAVQVAHHRLQAVLVQLVGKDEACVCVSAAQRLGAYVACICACNTVLFSLFFSLLVKGMSLWLS